MKKITFEQVIRKLKKVKFGKFDLIVAIGKGGIIPAALVQNILNVDMHVLWLNFRDEKQCPKHKAPKLVKKLSFNFKGKRILVVDDVSRTGATLGKAKEILKGSNVKTFVVDGYADYSLYNHKECVRWPWN